MRLLFHLYQNLQIVLSTFSAVGKTRTALHSSPTLHVETFLKESSVASCILTLVLDWCLGRVFGYQKGVNKIKGCIGAETIEILKIPHLWYFFLMGNLPTSILYHRLCCPFSKLSVVAQMQWYILWRIFAKLFSLGYETKSFKCIISAIAIYSMSWLMICGILCH